MTLKHISPRRSIPPIADNFFQLKLHSTIGVRPFRAHVLPITGVCETPASSTRTRVPPVSSSLLWLLPGEVERVKYLPDMVAVVPYFELFLDEPCYSFGGPEIGFKSVILSSFLDHLHEPPSVVPCHLRRSSRVFPCVQTCKRVSSFLVSFQPLAYNTFCHPELSSYLSLRQTVLLTILSRYEELDCVLPSLLKRQWIPPFLVPCCHASQVRGIPITAASQISAAFL